MKSRLFVFLLVSMFSFPLFAENPRTLQYECWLNRSVQLRILFEYEDCDEGFDITPDLVLQTKLWNEPEVKEIAVLANPSVVQKDKLLMVLANQGRGGYVFLRIEELTKFDDKTGKPTDDVYLRGLIDINLQDLASSDKGFANTNGSLLEVLCSRP
ncbi:MAG: hypothetical protein A3F16_07245 [Deltaproteobacteria bacterium RIFCSPHIGHO2_12_FULL_43_9]|nr:MAG: hypothetical protein A3F16_07245 [Deltaproteobacteria bacterium RIFCSPHIGHO2_12_FULL_43_9]